MVIAISPGSRWEWVAPCDRDLPPEQQTVWTLTSLDVRKQTAIADAAYDVTGDSVRFGTMQRLTLAYGIVDVRNFRDAEGGEIPIKLERGPHGQIVSDGFLSRIPQDVRKDLAEEITRGNTVDATDRKN